MNLWKKFWNVDIIGKIYILILLFIVVVTIMCLVTRTKKSKVQNEVIENVYGNKISMVGEDETNKQKDVEQEKQMIDNDSNNIKKEITENINNSDTIATKNEKKDITKKNVNQKNINTNKKKIVQDKQKSQKKDTKKETTKKEEIKEEIKKEEPTIQSQKEKENQEEGYSEYEVSFVEKEECKNNKHLIGTGNSNKWFETQKEADDYYNSVIAKYGREWENDDSEDAYEKYLKKCPYRL